MIKGEFVKQKIYVSKTTKRFLFLTRIDMKPLNALNQSKINREGKALHLAERVKSILEAVQMQS